MLAQLDSTVIELGLLNRVFIEHLLYAGIMEEKSRHSIKAPVVELEGGGSQGLGGPRRGEEPVAGVWAGTSGSQVGATPEGCLWVLLPRAVRLGFSGVCYCRETAHLSLYFLL